MISMLIASFVLFANHVAFAGPVRGTFESEVLISEPQFQVTDVNLRSDRLAIREREIQTALNSMSCGRPTFVMSKTSPYKPAPKEGDYFQIESKDCKIKMKSLGECEIGFSSQKLPTELGLEKYKVCQRTFVPSSSTAATNK